MKKIIPIIVGIYLGLWVQPAHAYIDPGTGSVVTSAIIGFFAALAYTLRKYFYKLKDLFSSSPSDASSSGSDKSDHVE